MATFILLSAIPGSGKSTWARAYCEEHPNTYIIASDEIRIRLTGQTQDFRHENEVWATYLHDINSYVEADPDCTVIGDSTNLKNEYRLFYCKNTPKFDKHILVVFNIPLDVCLLQNRMRPADRIVPDKAVKRMYEAFEVPSQEVMDAYDEVLFIGKSYRSKEASDL